eukprot:SAG22_NODE_180_length_16069_cov_5.323231_8_plen_50_part_00
MREAGALVGQLCVARVLAEGDTVSLLQPTLLKQQYSIGMEREGTANEGA